MSESTPNASFEGPVGADPALTLRRSIGIGATVLTIMTMIASVMNYASNLIFSRLLEPVGYGELITLLALALVITIPSGAAQTVIAERVAFYRAEGERNSLFYLIRHAIVHVTAIAAAIAVIYTAVTPLLAELLNLQDIGPAIALAPFIFLTFVLPVALGVAQGMDHFIALGSILVTIALSRIIFGVAGSIVDGSAGAVIAGQAIGMFVVLGISAWMLRDLVFPRGSGAARSGLEPKPELRVAMASAAFIAFAVLSNLDILLAKMFMSGIDVGMYAAIATVGKIVLFASMAVPFVMVPHAAREHREHGASGRSLRISGLIVLAISLVVAVPAAIAPDQVVKLMFGSDYAAAAPGVRPILVAGAGLALLYLVTVYSATIKDRRWFNLLLVGVALQIIGISLFHSSPVQVATVQAAVIVVVLLLNEHLFHSIVWPWGGRRIST